MFLRILCIRYFSICLHNVWENDGMSVALEKFGFIQLVYLMGCICVYRRIKIYLHNLQILWENYAEKRVSHKTQMPTKTLRHLFMNEFRLIFFNLTHTCPTDDFNDENLKADKYITSFKFNEIKWIQTRFQKSQMGHFFH